MLSRSDFHYDLPGELIAQEPPRERASGRLLCLLDDGTMADRRVRDLPDQVRPGDLLIFNDTRVIPARLFGEKDSGGKVEILVERLTGERDALAQVRASKAPRAGTRLRVAAAGASLHVLGREGEFFLLQLEGPGRLLDVLESAGHVPLPPYIKRPDERADRERYQTVYARAPGAVAAPTAGLHFDSALLDALRARGAELGYVTLHVGAGTFQPVRVDNLAEHQMHRERITVGPGVCEQIRAARGRGGRIVAVGTTVVRALESAADGKGGVTPLDGETQLFITPGYRFRVVDALLTNFHLPESTLLMLVCAFGGRERVLAAYAHAVRQRYRFFSYGDAMWLSRREAPAG